MQNNIQLYIKRLEYVNLTKVILLIYISDVYTRDYIHHMYNNYTNTT